MRVDKTRTMCGITPSSGPLPGGNTKGTLCPQCQEFRFCYDRGHDHHVARVDASGPGVEKGLCGFFELEGFSVCDTFFS